MDVNNTVMTGSQQLDSPRIVPEIDGRKYAVGATVSAPSMTFSDKNITFTGDLKTFDYNAILRDKQGHINELYQLSDYFIDADPIFRGIIKQVYTPFAIADDWKLVGANEEVKKKYEDYYERIGLKDKMEAIFYQYFKYANVFIYLMPDGRIITLPPHLVRVGAVQVNGEPMLEFNCKSVRDDLKQQGQKAMKDYLEDEELKVRVAGYPEEVAKGIRKGEAWVQLNPENTFALQDVKEDWMRYAIPMIASCLKALQKKEIISNWENACLNLGMRSFVHVKYGDPDGRVLPNTEQLNAVMNLFKKAMTGSALAVTNKWAEAEFIQPDLDEMFSDNKYAGVNGDILSAGGISGMLVSGRTDDGSTFATAQVSMQTAAIRIRKARNNFCDMMNRINARLNANGGRVMPHSNEKNIPKFTFPPVDLAGSKQFQEHCFRLWQEGMVSKETLLTAYGLDIAQEKERRSQEKQNGTDEVLVDRETYSMMMQQEKLETSPDNITSDEGHEGMVKYTRNGRTYWRRNTRHSSDEDSPTGRPTLSDSERHSDPYNSVTGRNPKPSNPEGSEAQT